MNVRSILLRLPGAYARRAAKWFGRRSCVLRAHRPTVTFTFDDFPRSALLVAGSLLEEVGARGTYFVSHGLAGKVTPTGEMFHTDDLSQLLERGHEFGCHTYHHLPAWTTAASEYENSVKQNLSAHAALALSTVFHTHSYPISYPRPSTKRRMGRRFRACRGGGQSFNAGTVDLNYLNSFFLEQASHDFTLIERALVENAAARGWLIFSTHDVTDKPTRFGVTPSFFSRAVQRALKSGADVVVMSEALGRLGVPVRN